MKLVVISSTKGTYPETKIVTEMFDNGLETFHLRKPSFNKKKMGSSFKKFYLQIHAQ